MLAAQGHGETVIEPRSHLFPHGANGHFNVLRGATPRHAGVKVVGDYVDNHLRGLPSELALLLLMDPETGVPVASLDASAITETHRSVTAIGAEPSLRRAARWAHRRPRHAYWNVRLLCRVLPGLEEIRVHSRRPGAASSSRVAWRGPGARCAPRRWEECVRAPTWCRGQR